MDAGIFFDLLFIACLLFKPEYIRIAFWLNLLIYLEISLDIWLAPIIF
jgi:hypothetical protein